eukprot:jgi/Mesen1/2539/ME000161S01589
MMDSMAKVEATVEQCEEQMRLVLSALESCPSDPDALEMKAALEDVLQLSRTLLSSSVTPQSPEDGDTKQESSEEVLHIGESTGEEPSILRAVHTELCAVRTEAPDKYLEGAPDFVQLAQEYPSLQPYIKPARGYGRSVGYTWTDYNATRELTKVLLHKDYGIDWWLQDGQLCPTVPNRANYVAWIAHLLSLCEFAPCKERRVRGVDVGTGANCIYALLGAARYGWHFLATDVTDEALAGAAANLERNRHLAPLIELRRSVAEGQPHAAAGEHPVLAGVVRDDELFDFCMCNPPFFCDISSAGANPRTACGGTAAEMVCSGGEAAFIARMLADSIALGPRIRWYTTLVGRKVNLSTLKQQLQRHPRVAVVKTVEFRQGRTTRWGLAWSCTPVTTFASTSVVLREHTSPRMSFTLQGLTRRDAAAHVAASLAACVQSVGATSCSLDKASLCVSGTYQCSSTGTATAAEREPPGKRQRISVDDGGGATKAPLSFSFRAQVYEQAPGSLTVAASVASSSSPAG